MESDYLLNKKILGSLNRKPTPPPEENGTERDSRGERDGQIDPLPMDCLEIHEIHETTQANGAASKKVVVPPEHASEYQQGAISGPKFCGDTGFN